MSEAYFKEVDVLKGPILKILRKEGYQAVDMHCHTKYSLDGVTSVKKAIKRCKKENRGIAITDHNNIRGSLKANEVGGKDVFIVPGIEVTCHNGVHILLHFYSYTGLKSFFKEELKKDLIKNPWFISLNHRELVDVASDYNCLITAAHPYNPGFAGIKKFKVNKKTLKKIDGVEVINGTCTRHMNKKSIKWGEKINKGFTGGSDGHCLVDIGNSLTMCKGSSREEFLNQIKKKKSIVMGIEQSLFHDAVHSLEKFVYEEKKIPGRKLKKMWEARGLLEWSYLKNIIKDKSWLHHFHIHHHDVGEKEIMGHELTEHLAKYINKQRI